MMNLRANAKACTGFSPFVVFVVVFGICITSGCVTPDGKVSQPFRYEGYDPVAWTGNRRTSEFAPMQDGVKLAVDIVLPTGFQGAGSAPNRFPVIFRYTPYGRSNI